MPYSRVVKDENCVNIEKLYSFWAQCPFCHTGKGNTHILVITFLFQSFSRNLLIK